MSRIMLIDDEQPILDALQRLISRAGWQVSTFTDPVLALNCARKTPFSLVISDYRMATMNGAEFLNKLNKIQPDIYKIMLSGQANQEGIISAINEGSIHHFMNKPWNNDQLLSLINKGVNHFEGRQKELSKLNKTTLSKQEVNDWYEEALEKSSPGITKVRKNPMGWIELD
ncbi:response regulator [Neptunomonas japonica]|uniref:Two-component system response regulator n=1 Tax=Neptunomonas japonica JAMM 1380 TaxID=1441457 RepID=A0A7R6PVL0_9GAMM|nr:response regulator [Neptunomonas japonica]BBB30403.1 two-component system response regulator [Neptunomonas japonica JAMM 1380]